MYKAGVLAADKYQPSDKLRETLADILKQWTEFVQSLGKQMKGRECVDFLPVFVIWNWVAITQ